MAMHTHRLLWCVHIGSGFGLQAFLRDLLIPRALFSYFHSELCPLKSETLERTHKDTVSRSWPPLLSPRPPHHAPSLHTGPTCVLCFAVAALFLFLTTDFDLFPSPSVSAPANYSGFQDSKMEVYRQKHSFQV
ncbi:hypothetical protein PIB30_082717 [Stylosanthes scabra]|uniref:Uncharacterized protein n=1 Tax=Stylosanthes scabra TaxID=79078 RepID=A0ABU6YPP1_9FABA|nr:hypothetical protein [Stylosanthes scabra]